MFYADVDHSGSTGFLVHLRPLPMLTPTMDLAKISNLFAQMASTNIFTHQRNIYSVSTTAGSLSMLNNSVLAIEAADGNLYFVKIGGGLELHFGAINPASACCCEHSDSPISIASSFSTPLSRTQLFA
ncbi:MAG: hypothetical protein R3C41_07055 [Calditrichia bacterium]